MIQKSIIYKMRVSLLRENRKFNIQKCRCKIPFLGFLLLVCWRFGLVLVSVSYQGNLLDLVVGGQVMFLDLDHGHVMGHLGVLAGDGGQFGGPVDQGELLDGDVLVGLEDALGEDEVEV